MAPILGYWSIRGLAEPMRYLLHYTETEYEEKLYDIGPDPATSKAAWLADKDKLGLKFPNLPYYIDGDLKLTESAAIAGHLARKHNLAGDCEEDYIKLEVAQGVVSQINLQFTYICYLPEHESKMDYFVGELPKKIKKFSELIEDGDYILGNKISYMDFHLFEVIERCLDMFPDSLADQPNLLAYHKRIASLPAIAKFRQSPAFLQRKRRFNARSAFIAAGDY